MSRTIFEPTIPAFEHIKTIRDLARVTIVLTENKATPVW